MKPLHSGLQDIWGDITNIDSPSVSVYQHFACVSFGAYLVLKNENARIAWSIHMLCQRALTECIQQKNEYICDQLRELS